MALVAEEEEAAAEEEEELEEVAAAVAVAEEVVLVTGASKTERKHAKLARNSKRIAQPNRMLFALGFRLEKPGGTNVWRLSTRNVVSLPQALV